VDDQGFDFRKPPERREPKPFEPPPWEREAFEALKAERPGPRDEAAAGPPTEVTAEPELEQESASIDSETEAVSSGEPVEKGGINEAEVIELLSGLAAEEPDATAPVVHVTTGAAILLGALGTLLLLWGMAAVVRAGQAEVGVGIARTGAVTMAVFGAGFLGSAVWLVYRLLKQRGVL